MNRKDVKISNDEKIHNEAEAYGKSYSSRTVEQHTAEAHFYLGAKWIYDKVVERFSVERLLDNKYK